MTVSRATTTRVVAVLVLGTGLAGVPAAAQAYPVPGPDLCEMALAHALDWPGFDHDDPADLRLFSDAHYTHLLNSPPCTSTRSIPVPEE
jgi:predicted TPR repeat methyltransferase